MTVPPSPQKDSGLFNAWWLTFFGAIGIIIYLCVTQPDPYWRVLKFLPDGVLVTFQVTILSILLSLVIGLFTGLGRLSRNKFINLIASTYVEVIRGIPLLVQLFYIYFALGRLDLFKDLPPMAAAVLAMGSATAHTWAKFSGPASTPSTRGRPKRPGPWVSTASRP